MLRSTREFLVLELILPSRQNKNKKRKKAEHCRSFGLCCTGSAGAPPNERKKRKSSTRALRRARLHNSTRPSVQHRLRRCATERANDLSLPLSLLIDFAPPDEAGLLIRVCSTGFADAPLDQRNAFVPSMDSVFFFLSLLSLILIRSTFPSLTLSFHPSSSTTPASRSTLVFSFHPRTFLNPCSLDYSL